MDRLIKKPPFLFLTFSFVGSSRSDNQGQRRFPALSPAHTRVALKCFETTQPCGNTFIPTDRGSTYVQSVGRPLWRAPNSSATSLSIRGRSLSSALSRDAASGSRSTSIYGPTSVFIPETGLTSAHLTDAIKSSPSQRTSNLIFSHTPSKSKQFHSPFATVGLKRDQRDNIGGGGESCNCV